MQEKEDWLKERTKGIGGSDASVVLGINPWKSRLELWNEKVTGNIIEKDTIDIKWGKLLEPLIIEEYRKKTGRNVVRINKQLSNSDYPYMIANLDSIISKTNNETYPNYGVLECKTKGAFISWEEYEDGVPHYYMTQIQHYLAVTGFEWGSFAIMDFGKKDLVIIDVTRNEEMIKLLINEEKVFWDLVESRIPPKIESTKACQDFLRNYYPESVSGKVLDLVGNEEAMKWADILKEVKKNIKEAEVIELDAKNNLMNIMGNAEKAIGDGFSMTWKSPKDREVFDIERFKKEHPQLYGDYVSKEKQTRRFTVRFEKDK